MIGGTPPPVTPNGVKVERGALNVMLPLLLTYAYVYVVPKKLAENPRLIRPVDPSSLAGRLFVVKPGSVRTA